MLTQDVGLQPALEVSTQVKRRAEAIFDKEQELLVEEANTSRQKDPDLYVNEYG
jgi:mediator of replication checkpoint protein 1